MAGGATTLPRFDRDGTPTDDEGDTTRLDRGRAAGADGPELPAPPPGTLPLVRAAWPLISVLNRLAGGSVARDLARFKRGLIAMIESFAHSAIADRVPPGQVSAARYILCTALDEAVLTTAWGNAGDWNTPSLLNRFHGETWGGETVFALLDRARTNVDEYRDILTIGYIVMSLGFQGRYRRERDGTALAEAVRTQLGELLYPVPPRPLPFVTLAAAPVSRRQRELFRYAPVWTVAVFCALLSLCYYAWLDYELRQDAGTVAATLQTMPETVGTVAPASPPPVAATKPSATISPLSVHPGSRLSDFAHPGARR